MYTESTFRGLLQFLFLHLNLTFYVCNWFGCTGTSTYKKLGEIQALN